MISQKKERKGEKEKNDFFVNVNKNKATLHHLTPNPKKLGYGLTLTL